jgi:hypothetical protein
MDFWLELLWRSPITAATAVFSSVISFAVYQWLTYRWQQRLRRQLMKGLEAQEKEHGQRQVALVLSVLTDIRQAAVDYLTKQGFAGSPVFQVHQAEGFGQKEEQWFSYLEKVKAELRKIKEAAATRVYLFTNLPLAMALFAGATLTNGPEVVVHHFQNGYHPVGRLTVETVRL